jgi:hypothetical protein
MLAGDKYNITPAAAVSTAWPPARDIFFPSKRETAVAAVPGLDANFYLVDEHADCWTPAEWQGCRTAGKEKEPLGLTGGSFLDVVELKLTPELASEC